METCNDIYSSLDILIDLIKLPQYLWRRIRPIKGKIIETKIDVSTYGKGWSIKSILIEQKDGKRYWINCEIYPPENIKIGKTIQRIFFGRLFYREYYKKVYVEVF